MKDVITTLHSDEQTFYAIVTKAWQGCSANQKFFVGFNGIYTPEYIAQAISDLQAAKALPNFDMRKAALGLARIRLQAKAVVCNGLVQDLYTIIARAFSAGEVKSMRQAAGSSYYTSAASGNWNSANTLYGMVASFLVTYNDDLLNGNMPDDFAQSFTDAQSDFGKAFTDYKAAKDSMAKGSMEKNAANVAVQATLLSMLADGKAIFRQEPAKRKYFSYGGLKRLVAGTGKTGVRFALTQAVTEMPVANAVITMQPGNYTLYPEKNGIVVELLAADKYAYTITAPGMKTVEGSVKVKAGSVRRANVVFAAAEVVAAVATRDTGEAGVEAASKAS